MKAIRAGRAVHMSGGRVGLPHLWFILTDPDPATHQFVMVMAVTEQAHTDKTVSLSAGEHPFVVHETSVDYGGAQFMTISRLESAVRKGHCQFKADMNAELLEKVQRGLLASARTVPVMTEFCRARFKL